MPSIHWIPVIAAALSAFVLGGIWYSPIAFFHPWKAAAQLTDAQLKQRSSLRTFGGALLLSLVAAAVFSLFLGPSPSLALGLGAGFSAGLCWVATSFAINYLFECRPLKLMLINGGYHTLQFTLYGLILGLWH
ncbi:MAG: DUF1761 domain-containing protein [Proteobacteria bacterium]|nr:DUF1761 domain-containing protein [Pseudomonadota bacterium]